MLRASNGACAEQARKTGTTWHRSCRSKHVTCTKHVESESENSIPAAYDTTSCRPMHGASSPACWTVSYQRATARWSFGVPGKLGCHTCKAQTTSSAQRPWAGLGRAARVARVATRRFGQAHVSRTCRYGSQGPGRSRLDGRGAEGSAQPVACDLRHDDVSDPLAASRTGNACRRAFQQIA